MEPTIVTPNNATESGTRQSLRATIALAICGAIGGASILEAITSAWLHPTSTTLAAQPTADPIALVGAVIGTVATLVIQRRLRAGKGLLPSSDHMRHPAYNLDTALDFAPLTPMTWQPVPPTPALERSPDDVDVLTWSEPTICQIRPRPHPHARSLQHSGRQTYRRLHMPRRVSAQG